VATRFLSRCRGGLVGTRAGLKRYLEGLAGVVEAGKGREFCMESAGSRRRAQGLTPSGILAAAGVFEEEKERAGLTRRSKDHKRRRRTRPFLAFYFFYYSSQSRHA
jgi:hypothetical protein